jgi:hypothetical protein
MNSPKNVTINFNTDGSTVIEANNFQGVGCKDATKAVEMLLAGGDSGNIDSKPKPDFYATNPGMNTTTSR